ncbi:unnamed protein product [Didymodactylos carnosus]|uniref:Uncharacterized protein n=1 Tax=Didymodactylos carnosus TaxID=1234261 RepID=A0A814FNQ1_9BILA|nr:unnamed protein product [Didymodactylos carnosus]CAF0987445.1 unnamed protein product [Didymodactylos carnosus]CAF3544408.1 unnamed protein product [Didymodactylos carnosus]CAF3759596.1 unnamed protein product [Didymodactylos carnosus]
MNFFRTATAAYSNVMTDPNWPKYEILESHKEYEKRKYSALSYVATQFEAKTGDEPVMSHLWKLVKYTQGGNSDVKILKIYLPVMVKVKQKSKLENNFTLMLVLEKEDQINPPKPTVEGVFILNQPECIVYSNGFAKEADWKRESIDLMKNLHSVPINHEEIISATYDLPTKLMNRHNEVMFIGLDNNNKTFDETIASYNELAVQQ